eukprot:TRINITY_DN7991_c0_g1_i1.p1 TRINITY_DN7991_c0_g1~~TRINITY_DN7991_c0_g1_i1.p1  ORF type:complete len:257 (-),score=34.81 TRINITY_DN7991_c0_g1_i1:561-1331(-)
MPMLLEAASYLQMKDVASWRAVDSETKEAFEIEGDDNVWRYCAQNEFGDKLFATYGLYERSERQLCFKFHSMLSRAIYMMSSTPLIVHEPEEASLIEERVRNALCVCSAHGAESERDAHVLLGEFFFGGDGSATMFQLGGADMQTPFVGLPPGVLKVELSLDGGALLSRACYGVEHEGVLTMYRQAESVQLTLHVDSADMETVIAYRGIPLILDGFWRSSRNGCYSKSSASGKEWGVLCVLSLLDGQPTDAHGLPA